MRVENGKIVPEITDTGEVSERERVRKMLIQRRWVKYGAAVLFLFGLCFMAVRAGREFIVWAREGRGEIETEREVRLPSVEVVDEVSGRAVKFDPETRTVSGRVSLRMLELVAELEEEFSLVGRKVTRARIPVGKIREIDLEVEGAGGVVKVSVDRNAAVSAEDADRMLKYLAEEGVEEFEYIDVRIPRKGYWK